MDWSYTLCTIATSKLPKKYKVEGTNMAYHVAYFLPFTSFY
jgi:hypothetical protein